MATACRLSPASPPTGFDARSAVRRRVLMRASMRMRGHTGEWPLTVKDISASGLKGMAGVNLFPGARLEICLPNLGWIPGEVVRTEGDRTIAVRFRAIIDPGLAQVQISGAYGAPPPAPPQLRRV